jgi:hypothetical protein
MMLARGSPIVKKKEYNLSTPYISAINRIDSELRVLVSVLASTDFCICAIASAARYAHHATILDYREIPQDTSF